MPYRVDVPRGGEEELSRLVDLGALDADLLPGGGVAAVMPDTIPLERVAAALGVADLAISPAVGRDSDSVWVLAPRPIHLGRLRIVPAGSAVDEANTIQLADSLAFGTGLHATTAMCLEALEEAVESLGPRSVLDVGTGSGVLALAALTLGVPRAVGIDIEDEALRAAAENARINGVRRRLRLVKGGPEAVTGTWPLILANVLAAPLIEMAPALARRLRHGGQIVLSGIPASVEDNVARAYSRQGLVRIRTMSRDGWLALVMQTSW